MVEAWKLLIQAAESDPQCRGLNKEPFKFDLIDLGREVLAQISTPAVLNFSDATEQPVLNKDEIENRRLLY
jgi:hypothetical protein